MSEPAARSEDLTGALVDYLVRAGATRLDPAVDAEAKYMILDLAGACVVASSPRYAAGRLLGAFVDAEGGAPRASVFGRPQRTSLANAALANGTLGYYCDVEPHHPASVMHALAAVFPAALAVGEAGARGGRAVLTAAVIGVDVACRLSEALDPRALYARGFHPSAVAGAFGAAVAAGCLLDLDRVRWRNALGLASLQASGLLSWTSDHSEQSRPFNIGIAARNGVTAASLAALGFGGPTAVLEGKYDLFTAFSGVRRPARLTDGLGVHYATSALAVKRYSCCAFLHPGLDALTEILDRHGVTAGEIASIDFRFPRSGASVIDNNELRSHNAQYILAVAAVRRAITIDDILADQREDPEIARLSRSVRFVHDDALDAGYPEQYSTVVSITTADGRRHEARVDHAKGTPQNRMTHDEVAAKYRAMTAHAADPARVRAIADLVLRLEAVDDVRALGDAIRALR
ncbi:MAG TPA: MmgE/PrpD family protein [bacterium]|nr:MmgE/PrpD family protein [bacterium]